MKKLRKIAISRGYDSQSMKLIEEMAGLTQAIVKHVVSKEKAKTLREIKHRIAAVLVMLEQIVYLLDLDNNDIDQLMEYEINGQLFEIKSEGA